MATPTTAVYLYCLVRAVRKPTAGQAPAGLAGATHPEVSRLSGTLWIVTAEVPLAIYGPGHLEARLRDLDWVSVTALAHEAVVEHFARRRGAVVIPTKLFTLFWSVDKAIAEVGRGRAAIERVMKHVAGSEEWGIRVSRRLAVSDSAAPATTRPASGAAFLTARKAARDAAATLRRSALEASDTAFTRLRRLAKDATRRERRQEPGANPPVLEAAFLVTTAARARFKAEAKRQAVACAAAGVDLTLTGPWPPYHFVGSEMPA